ncbi:hypothetical protein AB0G20_36350 [Streptomyces sp. NPDC024017]|uniref:hypothetical protein n=1 Tax=Streptomyces sp. NPDC024017 TaxID=3154326 RepID=UPI0033EEF016
MPDPETHTAAHPGTKDEFASRARAEALAMTGQDTGQAHRPAGELVAAALKAHRTLVRGLGRSVPLTALGPDAGVRGLTAFLAVYAARHPAPGDGPSEQAGERGEDVVEFVSVHGQRLGREGRRVEDREDAPQGLRTGVAGDLQGERLRIAARLTEARA